MKQKISSFKKSYILLDYLKVVCYNLYAN